MNTETGQIMDMSSEAFQELSPEQKVKYKPFIRDLSMSELATRQLDLYAPCGCGSGKKFKFCCKK